MSSPETTYGIYLPPPPEADPAADIKPTAVGTDADALQRARKSQHGDLGVVVETTTAQDDIKAALGLPYFLEPGSSAGTDRLKSELRHELAMNAARESAKSEVEAEAAEAEKASAPVAASGTKTTTSGAGTKTTTSGSG